MSKTTRTFIAVDVPAPLKKRLRGLQERLASQAPGIRWIDPALCHLTLAFLGDVPDADLAAISQAFAGAVQRIEPFALTLAGLGAFPSASRPRVVWTGLAGDQLDRLQTLHQAVVRALKNAERPPADDRFSPHVTIGRLKPTGGPLPDLTALLARHESWSGGEFPISEIVTFASVRTSNGQAYQPLSRAPLGSAAESSGETRA